MPLINTVQNPSAEGATSSLGVGANGAVTMVSDVVTGPGLESYRAACTTAADSSFVMRVAERPVAAPGQRWHFRARARLDATLVGARRLRCELVFRSATGANLPQIGSHVVDVVPDGVFHRWAGTANASRSERYEGTSRRINDIPDPLFTNGAFWYKNPKATYDFTQAGGVAIVVATGALSSGELVTYPSAAAAPNEYGTPKAASYKIANTGSAAFTLYGNIRAYGATASLDGPTAADVTIAPGETVLFQLPAVTPTADSAQGYRALIRVRGTVAVGQSMFVSEHIGEDVASAADAPGSFFSGSSVSTGTGNPQRVVDLITSAVAPAGAASAYFAVYRSSALQAAADDVVFFDALLLAQSEETTTPDYGDGSFPGWAWSGTAHGSTSSKPLTAPALNAIPQMTPVPRVEFKFDELLPGTTRATVFRLTGKSTKRVRGAINVYAAGGFSGIDTEAPFNVKLTYRAEMFNAAGVSLGFTDARVVTVAFDGTVVHQPLDPTRAALVDLRPKFAEEISRPFEGEVVYPIGSTLGVYIGSGRQGVTGVDLTVITDTLDQADAFASIWGDPSEDQPQLPVVCIRTQPEWRLPMPLFAAVLDPTEARFDTDLGGETINWPMRGTEVRPPVEALARALLTYADFEASFSTYEAFENAYLTYFNAESDFDLAGTGA